MKNSRIAGMENRSVVTLSAYRTQFNVAQDTLFNSDIVDLVNPVRGFYLDEVDEHIRTLHLVCDHVSAPHGKKVRKWLAHHPRFSVHFTPVHGSWMHQVEQRFSILQR